MLATFVAMTIAAPLHDDADEMVPEAELAQAQISVKGETHLLNCGFRTAMHAFKSASKNSPAATKAYDSFIRVAKQEAWSKDLVACVGGKAALSNCRVSKQTQHDHFDGADEGTIDTEHAKFYREMEKFKDTLVADPKILASIHSLQKVECADDNMPFEELKLNIDSMNGFNGHGDKVKKKKIKASQDGEPTTALPTPEDALPPTNEVSKESGKEAAILVEDEPTPNCDACMKKQTGACVSADGLCDRAKFKLECITESDKVKKTAACAPGRARFEACLDTCKVEAAMELPTGRNTPSEGFPASGMPADAPQE